MATNYPGSLDTSTQQPSPSASTEMDDSGFEHDVVHANHSGAIIAVETKVGTGASTPVANSVLGGTGSGTSAWTTTPTLSGLAVSGTISQPWGNEITQTGVTNTKFIDVNYTGGIGNHVDLSVPNNGSAGLGDTVMRLVDGGNIGIGAATPDTLLHVSGATNTVAHFESTDAEGMIAFSDSDSTGNWYDRRIGVYGDDLSLVTNGARRMTIQDDGKVGIGTTTPYAPLQVYNSATDTIARFGSGDPGVYISFYDNTSANETNARLGAYGDKLVFLAGGSDRMVIASDGDIGIGTTTPGQRLHVNAGTNNTVAMFESTDTTAYIAVADSDTSSGTYVGIGAIGDALRLRSGNANHFAMDSSGNVGIGTTSPSTKLDVNGTGQFSGRLLVKADGNDILRLRDTGSTSTGGYISFEQSAGSRLGYVGYPNNDDLYIKNEMASGIVLFATNNTTRMVIQADGDVGIGTTSPTQTLTVNAGTANNTALFESTDSTTYVSLKDNSTSGNNYVAIGAVGDEMRLRANNTNLVKLVDPSLQMTATDGTLIAADPPTGTGNDAEWVTAYGLKVLSENTSVAASKENITTDLGTHLTADMIDSVVPKMWNRTRAPGYPEIGPIAEDMDAISPFLAAHGTTVEGEQLLTGINKTGYLSLLVLAVKDLRQRVVELENA